MQAEAAACSAGTWGWRRSASADGRAQERVTVRRDWNDGRLPSVVGTWRMDDFGPAFAPT
jgi:hypothetical protein